MKTQHKIIVIPLAVMIIVGLISMLTIETYLEKQILKGTETELQRIAAASLESVKKIELIESELGAHDSESKESAKTAYTHLLRSFHTLAREFARAAQVRITYTDADGVVLGDSDISFEQLAHIENHSDRPEIQAALDKKIGVSQRYSSTLEGDRLYVAVRSDEEHYTDETSHLSHPLVARASRPLSMVSAAISDLRNSLLWIGVLSLLAVITLGIFGGRILTSAVHREQQLLEKRVESRTNEISVLQTLGGLLNACSTFKEAGEVLNSVIPTLLPGMKGSVSIIKSSRNRLDKITQWGGEWPGLEKFLPTDCWSLRKGHQHVSSDHGLEVYCNHWEGFLEQEKTLCMPLLAQGETIGVLHFVLETGEDLDQYSHLLNNIAEQIGLTLANIQLRDNLRQQAIRDPLTDLYNRRYMLESVEQAQSRAERTGDSIAILMIDLDHFKRFNDNFGHDAGDHVLKAAAQVLKDSLRQEDIACRYGGEEFCIVLPFTDEKHALPIAERIGKGIRTLELNMNQLSLGTVTASIGIAVFPECAGTIEDTIKAADEALYRAKQNGRDRIEVTNMACIESSKAESTSPEIKSA